MGHPQTALLRVGEGRLIRTSSLNRTTPFFFKWLNIEHQSPAGKNAQQRESNLYKPKWPKKRARHQGRTKTVFTHFDVISETGKVCYTVRLHYVRLFPSLTSECLMILEHNNILFSESPSAVIHNSLISDLTLQFCKSYHLWSPKSYRVVA